MEGESMKEAAKKTLIARSLIVSTILLFVMSFIDIREGTKMFHFSNPFIDEDWIITVLSAVAFGISLWISFKVLKK